MNLIDALKELCRGMGAAIREISQQAASQLDEAEAKFASDLILFVALLLLSVCVFAFVCR